jgi:hypothetical protein
MRHMFDEPKVAIAQTPEEAKASGVVQAVPFPTLAFLLSTFPLRCAA